MCSAQYDLCARVISYGTFQVSMIITDGFISCVFIWHEGICNHHNDGRSVYPSSSPTLCFIYLYSSKIGTSKTVEWTNVPSQSFFNPYISLGVNIETYKVIVVDLTSKMIYTCQTLVRKCFCSCCTIRVLFQHKSHLIRYRDSYIKITQSWDGTGRSDLTMDAKVIVKFWVCSKQSHKGRRGGRSFKGGRRKAHASPWSQNGCTGVGHWLPHGKCVLL